MPVPKRKRSKSRRDKRFANKGIKARMFATCSNCDDPVMSHAVCQGCGHYRGRKVITTKADRSVTRGENRNAKAEKLAARTPQPEAPTEAVVEEPKDKK
jgi:large subunit ribosomal protein L32